MTALLIPSNARTALGGLVIYQESAQMLLALAQRPFADPSPSSAATHEWAESLREYLDSLARWAVVDSLVRWREIESGLVTLYRACPFLGVTERQPEWRPDIIETVNIVIDVVSNKSTVKALLDLPREDACSVIDLLYGVVDNETRLAIAPRLANRVSDTLRRMCAKYQWLPGACIVPAGCLTLLGDSAIDCGGYADVWRAMYHAEGRSAVVALKVFRVYAKDKLRRVRKKFCEEAILWLRLRHKNIVPLLGADMTLFPVCLVSVWMKYGNISGYLRRFPGEDRLRLLIDVAEGLAYLHGEGMVHGDLKCANILINDERHACIGDFGLSAVIHDPDTIMSITPSPNAVGTLRWTAPEILDPESFGLEHAVATLETDVYSFGMVMWEIFSGHTPYDEYRYDATAQWKILSGVRPERPLHATGMGLSDLVWDLIQRCWHVDRHMRPAADTIVHELKAAHALFETANAQQAAAALVVEPAAYVPPGASLLARLRAAIDDAAALSAKRERKNSSVTMSSGRSFTPPDLVHGKGSPSFASIAQTSAHAVFSRVSSYDTEPERSPTIVPARLRLRPEGSQRTLVDAHGGSTGTIKPESAGKPIPILPLLPPTDTAPIPFSQSPDSMLAPVAALHASNCPTPSLTWGGTPLPPQFGHGDLFRGSSAPEGGVDQHLAGTGRLNASGVLKDIHALEIQRELAAGNRNNSWVHDWGYTAGGW